MGILKSFKSEPSDLSKKGLKPAQMPGANPGSTLHFESSINDTPDIEKAPSRLDLDGKTPSGYVADISAIKNGLK